MPASKNGPEDIPISQMSSENGLRRKNLSTFFPCAPLMDLIPSMHCRSGLMWMALAIILQAAQIILVSYVTQSLGVMGALFIRSAFLLTTVPFVSWRKSESYGHVEMVAFILNGICDSLFLLFAALATSYIWVGDLSTISFNLPLPSTLIAGIIFDEAIDLVDGFLTVLNGCGLIFVSQPSFLFPQDDDTGDPATTDKVKGFILAGGSLVVGVTATLAGRSAAYRKAEDSFLFGTMAGLIGIMLSTFGAILTSSVLTYPRDLHGWSFSIALGLCATGAVCCYMKALETEHVLTVTVFLTLTIPLNNMFDLFVLGREMNWFEIGGVFLILLSTFCLFIKSQFTSDSP